GLVHVFDGRAGDVIADRRDHALQPLGAGAAHCGEGRRGKLHAEQIGHEGDEARFGQQLIVQQIDHEGGDPGPILHRRVNAFGEVRSRRGAASGAVAGVRTMFGDNQRPRFRQIEYLSRRVTPRHVQRQRRAAFGAGRGKVIFDSVGLGSLPQRLALVALLPARLPLGFLAQAAHPRQLLQPIARRRLAAVRTVQAEPALEFRDPRLQSGNFGRLRPDQRNRLFPRRLVQRFENHPILESEPESAVQKILTPNQARPQFPNLGSYEKSGFAAGPVDARRRGVLMDAVAALPPGRGLIGAACAALGLSRASFHRRIATARRPSAPVRPRPRPARALALSERQAVLDLLREPRFVDQPPAEVYAELLDQGLYHCSIRTMYRILHENGEVKERRQQLRHPIYKKPELIAEGPNQVWSWDITKLMGPAKWTYFYLYAIIDIFSRRVVAWLVADAESAALIKPLFEDAAAKHGVLPGQLTLHADRGPSMKAKATALLLADLGVTKSHSRPYTSNDNPFSESPFKTCKYQPQFPERFGSIQDAKAFCRRFFQWYNTEHHHLGIGLMTPNQVHYGQADEIYDARKQTLENAFLTNPNRFVKNIPSPPDKPTAVWINPPQIKPEIQA